MVEEIVESDGLCIGGDIAGLMAAIRASECGAKAVVVEKGQVAIKRRFQERLIDATGTSRQVR